VPAIGKESTLGLANRFVVDVDGLNLGSWAQCVGLEVNFNPKDIDEGGNNFYKAYRPDCITYAKVKLVRAMNATDTKTVMDWLSKVARDADGPMARFGWELESGSTAKITLYDAAQVEVQSWTLRNVYPSKWSGPGLDAMTSKVALETLELVHNGFLDT
jgi:phage tail-like protein